jgi:hypothetical protein
MVIDSDMMAHWKYLARTCSPRYDASIMDAIYPISKILFASQLTHKAFIFGTNLVLLQPLILPAQNLMHWANKIEQA